VEQVAQHVEAPPNWSPIVSWIKAREQLRLTKELGGPRPWTLDPILDKYRFCNVRRKDDRVSQWLLKNAFRQVHAATPETLMVTALFRWINWPPTIRDLLAEPWFGFAPVKNLDRIAKFLNDRSKAGVKTWTGAFMIRPNNTKGSGGQKGDFVVKTVVGGMLPAMPDLFLALGNRHRNVVHHELTKIYGWGSFMAGQVVDDWSWTPILPHALDTNTWAPMGPGSIRGLNRLLKQSLGKSFTEDEWCWNLLQIRGAVALDVPNITLMDIQNCLCEFDKYERVRLGEGRPKSLYKPEEAY
jgi:hypothetical protein